MQDADEYDITTADPWGTTGHESLVARYARATPENKFKSKEEGTYAEVRSGMMQVDQKSDHCPNSFGWARDIKMGLLQ